MKKTGVIYARVSTAGQAEDELPIDSQLETCRRKAHELEVTIMREFVDAGISGRTDERRAFKDAIAFCRMNRVDYFICWNTSRFARNRIDAPWHKLQLEKHGTKMVYAAMNLDSSTKEGWMLEGVLELVDEYYSRQVSDDTVRSMMKNARDGFHNGGVTPFGYHLVPDGKRKRLAIDEHESVIVREIFSQYLAGAGAKSIAINLNGRGCFRRGRPWSKTTLAALLKNWTYCGYIVFNRYDRKHRRHKPEADWVRTKSHAPIIDEETFMKVRSILSARSARDGEGSHKSTHLFTGLLRCGKCNRAMMIETATGRSATYSYYNCSGNIKGLGCAPRRIPADEFDRWLAAYIVDRIMSTENLRAIAGDVHRETGEWVKERARRRAAMVAELRTVEARRRRLYELMETKDPAALNLADVKPRLVELNARARSIETDLTQLELQPAPEVNITDVDLQELQEFVREVVLTSNNPQKVREFMAGFIEEVVISDGEARINYRKDRLVTAGVTEAVHSEPGWLPDQALLRTARICATLPARFIRKAA